MIVELDPGESWPPWMFVVVHRPTGVRYDHQYGGTACRQASAEGYLVPIYVPGLREELDEIFIGEFLGAGTGSGYFRPEPNGEPPQRPMPNPLLAPYLRRLSDLLEDVVPVMVATPLSPFGDGEAQPLRLNRDLEWQIDEAWIPVITCDGPGVLIWPNSD